MKFILIFNLFISYLIILFGSNKPAYASATILNCTGEIPKKTACIIQASSYNVNIRRIDLCQKDPFPNYRITADFSGSKCITLLNRNLSIQNDLDREKKFYISKDLNFDEGDYKYIAVILRNNFIISGKYKSENYFWATSKEGPKEIIKSKSNISVPNKFSTKLINWRGEKNLDNKYCKNNGGTPSRCDLQYNGFKMTAIGLDSDFVETPGNKKKYLFFVSEISPVVNLNKNTEGYFIINFKKNLEVFGDGSEIKSISIAPFKFKGTFISDS